MSMNIGLLAKLNPPGDLAKLRAFILAWCFSRSKGLDSPCGRNGDWLGVLTLLGEPKKTKK